MARFKRIAALFSVALWVSFGTLPRCARANDFFGCLIGQIEEQRSFYEATRVKDLAPAARIEDFQPQTGIFTKHAPDGSLLEARMRVLTDNPGDRLFVVGDFNGWGNGLTPEQMAPYELKPVPGTRYHEGVIPGLKHGDRYRLLLNGRQVIDPSAAAYTTGGFTKKFYGKQDDHLNSVFWDFDRPGAYRMRNPIPDLEGKHVTIGEIEVSGAVQRFPREDGGGVGPASAADTYAFIADPKTGFAKKLKETFGYNAVHVLPVNQSVDGVAWQNRYQVYGGFAPDTKFGTPEEFAAAVDALNGQGIGVIIDYLGSHFPYKRELSDSGLTHWFKENGQPLFSAQDTEWGTKRYDYANPFVRRFLIDGVVEMFKRFNLAGVRIDNVGGLLSEPGGRDFLAELASEIRKYKPQAVIMHEDFGGNDRAKSLLEGGLGASARNGSDFFGWIRENAKKWSDEQDIRGLRERVRSLWGNKEMSQIPYITNHDESANASGGASGHYFVSLVDGGGDFHSYGKTRAYNALAELLLGYSEDTPQMRLLQRGDLNTNPAVEWSRLSDPVVSGFAKFFSSLSRYVNGEPAFAFANLHENVENHTDYANKILSLVRYDPSTGKKIYALVNLSPNGFHDYRFGVDVDQPLKLRLDSDAKEFGGSGRSEDAASGGLLNVSSEGMHGKPHSVSVPYVAPYSVMILER